MIKLRSRNFLLIICSIFFFSIMSFAISNGLLRMFNELNNQNNSVTSKILQMSSKIETHGEGKFIYDVPSVNGTTIENFNVKLKKFNDSVKYSVKLCNITDYDFKVMGINNSEIICSNDRNLNDCSSVKVIGYVEGSSKNILKKGSCIDFVVDAKYVGVVDDGDEINLYVNKYSLKLEKK